jgi:hypothetical protein
LSTGSSSSRSKRRALPGLALALILSFAAAAAAAESVQFELAAAGEDLFPTEGATPAAPAPEPNSCVVIFRYSNLRAGDLNQMVLLDPDGRQLDLLVETLFVEFGWIADARMAFRLPESEAVAGRGPFTLKWGPEAAGRNSKVERIAADPSRRESYRTLRPKPGALAGGANIAKLEVIADSTAEYHFLWYLLPMSLVFALLLVRKLRAYPDNPSGRDARD